ncbi:uncharacterized protein MAM_01836 [Metarhizium album ARSEF 1941]|uniref:Uncharacterized protein n=1 Tax=Metarhizium album (strain ARSEF 1941) TaxID=1081103 RepID=A0A0B2X2F0_METAS|nr:uncharacterized protein MAM_01836 [Metarhizium album ARSEF 1941]KHN99912.1 hypothetical protein MAM_01836 [Metarhizium album ARSEF 1941]
MKVSAAFVITLFTGALATPFTVADSDSEERNVDISAGDFQDAPIANVVAAREIDAAVTLEDREVATAGEDEEEEVEIVARSPKKGKKKGKKGGKKATGAKKKAQNNNAAGGGNGAAKKQKATAQNKNQNKNQNQNQNQGAANTAAAQAPKVTNALDAPGVV